MALDQIEQAVRDAGYIGAGLVGAVLYAALHPTSARAVIVNLIVGTASCVYIAPAAVEFFNINSVPYILLVGFGFGFAGVLLMTAATQVISAALKDPKALLDLLRAKR